MSAAGGRDTAIDVIRGLAIVSMTFAHMSYGSLAHEALHVPTWIDGAIVFVMLSGLVLGMVQRSRTGRDGRPAYGAMVRRVRSLYVAYVLILLLALVIRSRGPEPASLYSPDQVGGWTSAIVYTLTLQMPAPHLTILPMYVVLMLGSLVTAWLLSRGRAALALGLASGVWLLGVVRPAWTVMPFITEMGVARFNWATWFLPFTLSFVVGWYWRERDIARRLQTMPVLVASAVCAALCGLLAIGAGLLGLGGAVGAWMADGLFEKWDLGLGVVVYASAVLILLHVSLTRLGASTRPDARRIRPALTWLAHLGSRSLDSFVILCVLVVLAPVLIPHEQSGAAGMAAAVLALVLMTAWSAARRNDPVPFDRARR